MAEYGKQRIVIIPDIQVPYHDKHLVDAAIEFVRDVKPDRLVQVGDLIDMPQPSRWNKGLAGEYEQTLQSHLHETSAMLGKFREALGPGKQFDVKIGNHDERLSQYVNRYAPALASLSNLSLESLLDTNRHGVTLQYKPFYVAPNWICLHGHENGGLRPTAGATAMGYARKMGKSIVCGHTHRAAIIPWTQGDNTLFGMEVGNLMNMKKAQYLGTGQADWQSALGVLDVEPNRRVFPQLVFAQRGQFFFEGKVYGG